MVARPAQPSTTTISPTTSAGKREAMVRFDDRVLYLTEDLEQLDAQLKGARLRHDPARADQRHPPSDHHAPWSGSDGGSSVSSR